MPKEVIIGTLILLGWLAIIFGITGLYMKKLERDWKRKEEEFRLHRFGLMEKKESRKRSNGHASHPLK